MARPRRTLYRVTEEYETCPDCSDRDAVSFTFPHVEARAIEDPAVVGGRSPVLSQARSDRGFPRTRGCLRCKGTGRVPVEVVLGFR